MFDKSGEIGASNYPRRLGRPQYLEQINYLFFSPGNKMFELVLLWMSNGCLYVGAGSIPLPTAAIPVYVAIIVVVIVAALSMRLWYMLSGILGLYAAARSNDHVEYWYHL